ncbi:hypothetical protein R80B4_00488 [Fibrobacteres bacterium R8-0-B4]
MKTEENITHEEAMARLAAVEKICAETARNLELFVESDKDRWKELDKKLKEFAEQGKELDKRLEKLAEEEEKTREKLEGIGVSNGMVAEDLVLQRFEKKKVFGGITYDKVRPRVWERGKGADGRNIVGEYDVLLLNGSSAAIIDVKYRVRMQDIGYLINTQLPKFRVLFPKYKKSKIYLGIGGMSFEEGVKAAALKKGIGVIGMNDDVLTVEDKNVAAW